MIGLADKVDITIAREVAQEQRENGIPTAATSINACADSVVTAHELLAALRKLREVVDRSVYGSDPPTNEQWDSATDGADAAIAKAEGRS